VGSLGHTSDAETGLIYMRARYMDPATGRFVSQDPASQGANWFVYATGDPVNQIDSDGRSSDDIGNLIHGLIQRHHGDLQKAEVALAVLGAALLAFGKYSANQTKAYAELMAYASVHATNETNPLQARLAELRQAAAGAEMKKWARRMEWAFYGGMACIAASIALWELTS
jgi:RHS repeat-associated protein